MWTLFSKLVRVRRSLLNVCQPLLICDQLEQLTLLGMPCRVLPLAMPGLGCSLRVAQHSLQVLEYEVVTGFGSTQTLRSATQPVVHSGAHSVHKYAWQHAWLGDVHSDHTWRRNQQPGTNHGANLPPRTSRSAGLCSVVPRETTRNAVPGIERKASDPATPSFACLLCLPTSLLACHVAARRAQRAC